MAILKNLNRERFTVIDNSAVNDNSLSLKGLGLLVKLLSFPNDWNFSEKGLFLVFEKDGQSSIRSGLAELEEFGYLKRSQVRDEKGRILRVEWIITENPRLENRSLDNPSLDNHPQYNTKEQKTKRKNKQSSREEFEPMIEGYTADENVRGLLRDWLDVRDQKGKHPTPKAVELALRKLQGCATESQMSVSDYLSEVIMRGWTGFYPIQQFGGKPQNGFGTKNAVRQIDTSPKPRDF